MDQSITTTTGLGRIRDAYTANVSVSHTLLMPVFFARNFQASLSPIGISQLPHAGRPPSAWKPNSGLYCPVTASLLAPHAVTKGKPSGTLREAQRDKGFVCNKILKFYFIDTILKTS